MQFFTPVPLHSRHPAAAIVVSQAKGVQVPGIPLSDLEMLQDVHSVSEGPTQLAQFTSQSSQSPVPESIYLPKAQKEVQVPEVVSFSVVNKQLEQLVPEVP